jgi:hypothetical protein
LGASNPQRLTWIWVSLKGESHSCKDTVLGAKVKAKPTGETNRITLSEMGIESSKKPINKGG